MIMTVDEKEETEPVNIHCATENKVKPMYLTEIATKAATLTEADEGTLSTA